VSPVLAPVVAQGPLPLALVVPAGQEVSVVKLSLHLPGKSSRKVLNPLDSLPSPLVAVAATAVLMYQRALPVQAAQPALSILASEVKEARAMMEERFMPHRPGMLRQGWRN
jgi:hypothetical protein